MENELSFQEHPQKSFALNVAESAGELIDFRAANLQLQEYSSRSVAQASQGPVPSGNRVKDHGNLVNPGIWEGAEAGRNPKRACTPLSADVSMVWTARVSSRCWTSLFTPSVCHALFFGDFPRGPISLNQRGSDRPRETCFAAILRAW